MSPNRWQQIKDLFNLAIEQPETEREAFLRTKTGGDTDLLKEVLSLLSHALPGTQTFDELQMQAAGALLDHSQLPVEPGEMVGDYRITRELGRGGMAVVFEAERAGKDFNQQVAIKVMKRGMDTAAIVERFRRERRLLAGLQHPAIARMYDGGSTAEGLPYFVMELCEGVPVDQFARDRSQTAIVEIMIEICEAVAYAHQRLIIHRDLKPGNILVSESGEVKLLDFGIAKLVTEEDEGFTHQGNRWMTPAYASPEQLEEDLLTTAADVYQLGVILLELLTDSRYFPSDKKRNPETAVQPPPSLPNDLRAIVSKATDNDPGRRYPSAAQLGEDLKRFLHGEPVEAQVPSFGYRFRKLIGRNKTAFAAATIVLLSVFTATGVSFWQADIARKERDKAETTLSWLERMFQSSNPMQASLGNPEITVKEFLDQSLPVLSIELADQSEVKARIYESATYMYAGLSEYDSAYSYLDKTLTLYEDGAPGKLRILMTQAQFNNTPQTLDSMFQACLSYMEKYPDPTISKADIWRRWGHLLVTMGKTAQGDSMLNLAIEAYQADPDREEESYLHAMMAKAISRRDQGFFDEADALFGKVTGLAQKVYPDNHPYIGSVYNSWGVNARYQQKYDTARMYLEKALTIERGILPGDHDDIITTLHNVALVMSESDSLEQAEELYKEILEIKGEKYGRDAYQYANTMQNLGLCLSQQKKYQESVDTLQRVYEIYLNVLGTNNPRVAFPLLTTTNVYYAQGAFQKSLETILRAEKILTPLLPATHPIMADIRLFTCRAWVGLGNCSLARPVLEELITFYQQPNLSNAYNIDLVRETLEKCNS